MFQVKHTLEYVPGRVYEKKGPKKVAYLREEREGGVPKSFSRLDLFLKERRVELEDFLADTTELAGLESRHAPADPMDIDEVENGEDSDQEQGPEGYLDESADEDLSDLDEEDEQ